jgi:hypothetical protein
MHRSIFCFQVEDQNHFYYDDNKPVQAHQYANIELRNMIYILIIHGDGGIKLVKAKRI